ncbi:PF05974 domain protein [Neorhizobium galegae bv. officinalis bv. officinalis str. HAMBI 1141]|uniref:PF05974 domain protein n=1 Tax=Neorhizobium galegae bv. officinalis bv. officinalis str. HAMBI 1141 TaxID=1028801 RepID=A0A068TBW6_NEOGA|nr:ferritin-like domain-containing protein [Neorhizobium galegae]CDN55604.1 PF05974 domain protein [Neorhizobium galegae bv. officinalis bv. officinalis str. HAMBI 1141]
MTHARDNFLAWLRAAHAMEEQAIITLSAQSRRIESYPDLKARIVQHLHETEKHAQALKALLDQFSGTGSALALKDMAAKLAAKAQGVGGMLTSDEVVKGAMASYAFEHMEIASYKVLIAAADELDEMEAKTVFERILGEEIAMANWLEANLDAITRVFLMRDERDLMAKR